jgi:hypothetical protein
MRKRDSKILVSLAGGLGNQLFQMAMAIYLSEGSQIELEGSVAHPRLNQNGFVELESFELPENIKLRKVKPPTWVMHKCTNMFLRMSASSRSFHILPGYGFLKVLASVISSVFFREFRKVVPAEEVGFTNLKVPKGKIYLIGLFQSFRWSQAEFVNSQLHKLCLKHPSLEYSLLEKVSAIENPLVVHIRLGDYLSEKDFGVPDKMYYKTAIEKAISTKRFDSIWLFSNDLKQARELLPEKLSLHIREIGHVGNSSADTLESMRLGAGYVIGNSTYSAWGAFLSKTKNAPVYYPEPWFKSTHSPRDLAPSNWIPVKAWTTPSR